MNLKYKLRSKRIWLVIALLTIVFATGSAAPSIRMSLRRGEAAPAVGQPFYIEVMLENIKGEMPRIKADGIKTLYHAETGHIEESENINGHISSRVVRIFTVTLRPERTGKIIIPPINIGGVRSNALAINVGNVRQQSGGNRNTTSTPGFNNGSQSVNQQQSGPRFIGRGNDNLFMVASINHTTAYEQQALVYTVKLYSGFSSLRFIGATESPKFDGFTLEEANPKINGLHFENYKGKHYACAVVARYIIFPQMKGKLTIKGNRYTVTAESRPEYWDPFWGNLSYGRPVQLSVQPNDLTIDVKPLPQPQPANYSGGVGKFSIKASMPTRNLATNQAASIVYTVSGIGNIKYVTLPDLAQLFPKEFEISTPTPDIKAQPDGNTVSGSVKFDCSIMPLEEGEFTLPAVDLVYFNPETGKYETAHSQPFKVNVAKGKNSASGAGNILKFSDKLLPNDEELCRTHLSWSGSANYWLIYIVSFAMSVAILAYTLFWRRRNADSEVVMARRARKMADRLLRHARKSLRSGEQDLFYDKVLTALWGYASHKLRMPGSEMQRSLLQAKMAEHQVPTDTIVRFIALLDSCEEAKYAGADLNMQETYDNAANVIRDIDTAYKK